MLTPAQLTTLATDINAQPSLATARTAKDWTTIAAFYNANSAINVWRPNVPVSELNAVANWVAFAALTAIKQNTYFAMTQGGFIDARQASVRSGFAQVWTVAADQTVLTNVAQRVGTRLEVLLVVSAGPPAVSQVFGSRVEELEIQRAMGF